MSIRIPGLVLFMIAPGALALGAAAPKPPAAPSHDLMPAPERLEWTAGRLPVGASFTMAVRGPAEPRVAAALARTRGRLEKRTGLRLPAKPGGEGATLLVAFAEPGLSVQAVTEDESYELVVSPRQARLSAANPLGVLRGLETFLQLVREEGGRYVVPAVRIEDRPRFPWRGLLIDPCRRFEPVEVIRRTLDAMAAVKLNVLHWHLSEDQGFRVESKAFPRLHEQGGEGQFYTRDQVQGVLAYARERGIRVVPEFDIPGHSTSWLVGYPELGSAPGPFTLVRKWGVFDNNLDPTRDEVYAFLDRFLGEMAGLFPDAYLHIGGDEVTPRQWNDNPAILDYMYRNRLDGMGALQAHFNHRVSEMLTKHGKRMVGWDEVLTPDLPKNIVVQSWRGAESLARAARLGFDGILSNGYYLDLMQSAAEHYLVDPIPGDSTLSEAERRHILGGEACMWGEFVDPSTIDSRLWPRAAAVAERLWSPAGLRDVEDMYRRLAVQGPRLEALGSTHRSGPEAVLRGIAGTHPTDSLRVLADVVEPIRLYGRGRLRTYTSATPLNRLVDATLPESLRARRFGQDVDRFLAASPGTRKDTDLRADLTAWRENHAVAEPILAASPLGAEARALSRDLAALAATGLQALEVLSSGRAAPAAWIDEARKGLERAQKVRAELHIAVVPAVCRLAYAAARLEAPRPCPAPAEPAAH